MRYFVIDGYNVLRIARQYAQIAETDLETARARLVGDVASFVGPNERAIVVFDGGDNPLSDGAAHEIAGVEVRFSAHGRDADEVIEEIVAGKRSASDEVVLVTSDQQLQWVTLGPSVTRRSSAEFASELADEQIDREDFAQDGSHTTILERIDDGTRRTLERWARGEQ